MGASLAITTYSLAVRANSNKKKQEPDFISALTSLLDTIIPEDEFSGAVNIGLDQVLLRSMLERPTISNLLHRLIDSINHLSLSSHKQSFHTLTTEAREKLLTSLLSPTAPRQVRDDLTQIRNMVVTLYYQSSAGQTSIGYRLPTSYFSYGR